MLDNEEAVNKFLEDLKIELMKGKMSPGDFGTTVTVSGVTSSNTYDPYFPYALGDSETVTKKIITIEIIQKSTATMTMSELDDHNVKYLKTLLPITLIMDV
jgi:hypothetical protein